MDAGHGKKSAEEHCITPKYKEYERKGDKQMAAGQGNIAGFWQCHWKVRMVLSDFVDVCKQGLSNKGQVFMETILYLTYPTQYEHLRNFPS